MRLFDHLIYNKAMWSSLPLSVQCLNSYAVAVMLRTCTRPRLYVHQLAPLPSGEPYSCLLSVTASQMGDGSCC